MTGYGKYTNFVVDHMAVISVCVNLAASFVLLKVASVKLVKGSRKRKSQGYDIPNRYTKWSLTCV